MINRPLILTYLYLLIYVLLSSGVILYNKVMLNSHRALTWYYECTVSLIFSHMDLEKNNVVYVYVLGFCNIFLLLLSFVKMDDIFLGNRKVYISIFKQFCQGLVGHLLLLVWNFRGPRPCM